MKIGIISINIHTKVLNHACPLHTYAFQSWLTEHGYESVVIDYKPNYINRFDIRHPYDYLSKKYDTNNEKHKVELDKWKQYYKEREKRYDRFEEFISRYYVKTPKSYTSGTLDYLDPGCDIYMCVTDVIWRCAPKTGFDRGFFLSVDTMKGKGKIAYAASKGTSVFDDEQEKEFKKLINDFDFISTREKSLCDFINKKTNKKATMVLDPVFLKDKKFYQNLAILPDISEYVLIYTVMEKAYGIIDRAITFAKEKGLPIIDVSDDKNLTYISPYGERKIVYDIGVEEWLGYMLNASYIFTNSFHCTAFSIIFNKDFYVGPRNGDKVTNILSTFGLDSRRMKKEDPLSDSIIDYENINKKIETYRAESERFITESLEKTYLKKCTFLKKTRWSFVRLLVRVKKGFQYRLKTLFARIERLIKH